ncbi:hypothetical protein QIS74_04766 [Colletotrichum tabaci]|uniref:CCHC-type domain-containing protein n=1 Tax=Colletotrichum tabaci TaxID=1209068 RepID=A0AAV9THD7_9PEZI
MAARPNAPKAPTPGSSASSGKQPARSLDEEMKEAEDSDEELDFTKKVYGNLQKRIEKNNNDIAQMQAMFNDAVTELESKNQLANKLQQEVHTLRAAANIIQTPMDGREKLKLNSPITYDGTLGLLKGFLIQWFEPFLEEYLNNETLDHCSSEVRDIFANFQGFEDALKSLFQDPDGSRQAERDLAHLRQTKSATAYAAEFRRLCAQLKLTEDTKIFMFYNNLKDEVKDEIVKLDRPEDFLQYAELAIKIDNRLYERRKEKGEKRAPANSAKKYQWQPQQRFQQNHPQRNGQAERPRGNYWQNNQNRSSTAYGHHSGPMDLSVAQKDNKTRDFKCYNCDKPGHMARECRQPKKQRFQPVPEKGRQINIANKDTPYASLSWTACYDDNCLTH